MRFVLLGSLQTPRAWLNVIRPREITALPIAWGAHLPLHVLLARKQERLDLSPVKTVRLDHLTTAVALAMAAWLVLRGHSLTPLEQRSAGPAPLGSINASGVKNLALCATRVHSALPLAQFRALYALHARLERINPFLARLDAWLAQQERERTYRSPRPVPLAHPELNLMRRHRPSVLDARWGVSALAWTRQMTACAQHALLESMRMRADSPCA